MSARFGAADSRRPSSARTVLPRRSGTPGTTRRVARGTSSAVPPAEPQRGGRLSPAATRGRAPSVTTKRQQVSGTTAARSSVQQPQLSQQQPQSRRGARRCPSRSATPSGVCRQPSLTPRSGCPARGATATHAEPRRRPQRLQRCVTDYQAEPVRAGGSRQKAVFGTTSPRWKRGLLLRVPDFLCRQRSNSPGSRGRSGSPNLSPFVCRRAGSVEGRTAGSLSMVNPGWRGGARSLSPRPVCRSASAGPAGRLSEPVGYRGVLQRVPPPPARTSGGGGDGAAPPTNRCPLVAAHTAALLPLPTPQPAVTQPVAAMTQPVAAVTQPVATAPAGPSVVPSPAAPSDGISPYGCSDVPCDLSTDSEAVDGHSPRPHPGVLACAQAQTAAMEAALQAMKASRRECGVPSTTPPDAQVSPVLSTLPSLPAVSVERTPQEKPPQPPPLSPSPPVLSAERDGASRLRRLRGELSALLGEERAVADRKSRALVEEDYDAAKECKLRQQQLRSAVAAAEDACRREEARVRLVRAAGLLGTSPTEPSPASPRDAAQQQLSQPSPSAVPPPQDASGGASGVSRSWQPDTPPPLRQQQRTPPAGGTSPSPRVPGGDPAPAAVSPSSAGSPPTCSSVAADEYSGSFSARAQSPFVRDRRFGRSLSASHSEQGTSPWVALLGPPLVTPECSNGSGSAAAATAATAVPSSEVRTVTGEQVASSSEETVTPPRRDGDMDDMTPASIAPPTSDVAFEEPQPQLSTPLRRPLAPRDSEARFQSSVTHSPSKLKSKCGEGSRAGNIVKP
eukprot:Hpha_TRINITY_DN15711_c1_g4::TRINITY_DN15711_c1_g4_i1::g.39076::m.39076